jgi:acyl-CoA synthetase (AMP-forming)/AMP-acid ligase II
MADVWERRVDASARQPFLLFQGHTWTYGDAEHLANRLAHWLRSEGVVPGCVVALMMGNCAQFVCVWLAVMKAGGATALINTQLRGRQLAHCLKVSGADIVVCGDDFRYVGMHTALLHCIASTTH